jgi:hypothetical protein
MPMRTPFGSKNAPALFQRLMDEFVRELRAVARTFIDNTIVHTKGFQAHMAALPAVFEKLRLYKIKVHPKKIRIRFLEIAFSRQMVNPIHLKPQEVKVAAIMRIPYPTSVTALKHFLIPKIRIFGTDKAARHDEYRAAQPPAPTTPVGTCRYQWVSVGTCWHQSRYPHCRQSTRIGNTPAMMVPAVPIGCRLWVSLGSCFDIRSAGKPEHGAVPTWSLETKSILLPVIDLNLVGNPAVRYVTASVQLPVFI